MLQHNDQAHCVNCGTGLQLQVKFCPFCGTAQPLDRKSDAVAQVTEVVTPVAITSVALVSHVTRAGKQLEGIILAGVDLDAAKTYDAYAFRKRNGIFIRLNQLKLVPDHLLSADQLNLKQQQALVESSNSTAQAAPQPAQKTKYSQRQNQDKNQKPKPSITQHQYTANSVNYSKPQAAQPNAASTQATSPDVKRAAATASVTPSTISAAKHHKTAQQNSTAQQSTPAQSQMQHQQPLMDPFTPVSAPFTIFKLKYFLMLIFAIILYMVFFKEKSAPEPSIVETPPAAAAAVESPVENCDLPNGQILSLLQQHKPSRALEVVDMYLKECQQNAQFLSYRKQAQASSEYAIQKFNLAQNYLSSNNINSAETALHQALEIDSELNEAQELLQAIAEYKAQQAKQQAPVDELEALIQDVEVKQQSTADALSERRAQQQRQAQQNAEQETQAAAQAKQQAEQAKQQAQQKAAEQQAQLAKQQAEQQAKQKAEQQAKQQAQQQAKREADAQKAEQAKSQKINQTVVLADRALGQHNYGTAKNLAKQVLAQDPSHPVAKRIIRQAEAGEAKAFEDMVIE